MSFYFLIAAVLWLLAGAAYLRPVTMRHADRAALFLFVAIAGLRFETGYDWLAYEHYFEAVRDPTICYRGPVMEPLFWALTKLAALVSSNVQFLFFTITALNAAALWLFCRHFKASFALAFAILFGWLYLTLQMGALRQSLAVSMFLVAFVLIDRKQRVGGTAAGLSALGLQLSSLLYLPLLWRAPWRWLLRQAHWLCAFSVLCLLLLPGVASLLIPLSTSLDLGFLTDKLTTYQSLGARAVTAPMIGYLLLNCTFLLYARVRLVKDDADAWLLAPLMLQILFQGLLAEYPIFWMRILFLAVTCQAVFIGRTLHREQPPIQKLLLLAAMLLGFAALAFFLRAQEKVQPYIPYRSVLHTASHEQPSESCQRSIAFYQGLSKQQRCAIAASARGCKDISYGTQAIGAKPTQTCYQYLLDEKDCAP